MLKTILRYFKVFIITLAILFGLLVLSCTIPQDKLAMNSKVSAFYLNQNESDYYTPLLANKFKIHNYADAIWLSMAYSVNSDKPLQSALEGKYYNEFNDGEYNIVFYQITVDDNVEPNMYYYRYWHGILTVLRPLLTVFTYMDIRYINVIVLFSLATTLIILLQKYADTKLSVIFAFSLLASDFFVVPFCMEYSMMFYIMLISSIIIIFLEDKEKIFTLFLITGMLANFFDFLTTETITLGIPLIISLYMMYKRNELKTFIPAMKYSLQASALWVLGFAFTWISKWVISALVLKINVFENVQGSILERSAELRTGSILKQLFSSVIFNIQQLFPFNFFHTETSVIILVLLFLLIIFFIWFLYRKSNKLEALSKILLIIALLPYLRYLVLNNHSYLHYWFTYRAQIVSILAILISLSVNIEKRNILKNKNLRH